MRTRTILWLVAAVALVVIAWLAWDDKADALGNAGPLPFFGAMAVLPAFGAPLTPFFLLAGASFGVVTGIAGSVVALAVNLLLSYWIARGALKHRLESILARFGYELPSFEEEGRAATRFALLVKLAPGLPGAVKHYGLALAGVPFATYFIVSMLVTGIYGAAVVVLGDSLLEHDVTRALVAGALIVALAGALWWWQSRRGREPRPLHRGATVAGRSMSEAT